MAFGTKGSAKLAIVENVAPEAEAKPMNRLAEAQQNLQTAMDTLQRFQEAHLASRLRLRDLHLEIDDLTQQLRTAATPEDVLRIQTEMEKVQMALPAARQTETALENKLKQVELEASRARDVHQGVLNDIESLKHRMVAKAYQVDQWAYELRKLDEERAHKERILESIRADREQAKQRLFDWYGVTVE